MYKNLFQFVKYHSRDYGGRTIGFFDKDAFGDQASTSRLHCVRVSDPKFVPTFGGGFGPDYVPLLAVNTVEGDDDSDVDDEHESASVLSWDVEEDSNGEPIHVHPSHYEEDPDFDPTAEIIAASSVGSVSDVSVGESQTFSDVLDEEDREYARRYCRVKRLDTRFSRFSDALTPRSYPKRGRNSFVFETDFSPYEPRWSTKRTNAYQVRDLNVRITHVSRALTDDQLRGFVKLRCVEGKRLCSYLKKKSLRKIVMFIICAELLGRYGSIPPSFHPDLTFRQYVRFSRVVPALLDYNCIATWFHRVYIPDGSDVSEIERMFLYRMNLLGFDTVDQNAVDIRMSTFHAAVPDELIFTTPIGCFANHGVFDFAELQKYDSCCYSHKNLHAHAEQVINHLYKKRKFVADCVTRYGLVKNLLLPEGCMRNVLSYYDSINPFFCSVEMTSRALYAHPSCLSVHIPKHTDCTFHVEGSMPLTRIVNFLVEGMMLGATVHEGGDVTVKTPVGRRRGMEFNVLSHGEIDVGGLGSYDLLMLHVLKVIDRNASECSLLLNQGNEIDRSVLTGMSFESKPSLQLHEFCSADWFKHVPCVYDNKVLTDSPEVRRYFEGRDSPMQPVLNDLALITALHPYHSSFDAGEYDYIDGRGYVSRVCVYDHVCAAHITNSDVAYAFLSTLPPQFDTHVKDALSDLARTSNHFGQHWMSVIDDCNLVLHGRYAVGTSYFHKKTV